MQILRSSSRTNESTTLKDWGPAIFVFANPQIDADAYLNTYLNLVGFPGGSKGKASACNAGDLGSIPGLGRSPGEMKGYPLQYSGLENSRDYIVHGVAKSQTRLSNFHFLPVIVLNPSLLVTHFILKKFLSDRKWHLVTHHCLFLEGNRQVQPAHERRKIKLHLLEEDMLKDLQTCSWASYQHAGCEDFLAGQWLRTTLQNRGCEFDPYLGN